MNDLCKCPNCDAETYINSLRQCGSCGLGVRSNYDTRARRYGPKTVKAGTPQLTLPNVLKVNQ